MRYHYQRGATKQRQGRGRLKLTILTLLLIVFGGYTAFLAALPGLGGWPYSRGDEVATQVRTKAPGSDGNKLYIPKINVAVPIAAGYAQLEGKLGDNTTATLRAEKRGFAMTPRAIIEKSPFSRLDQLSDGDEFFVDFNGTRFAYAVGKSSEAGLTLETQDKTVSVKAKPIGVVAWNGGSPRIEIEGEYE